MTATKTRRKSNKRAIPQFTAESAQEFQTASPASMLQVYESIAERTAQGKHTECECEPYRDTFTFDRFRAMGFMVNKGESALRISTFVPVTGKFRKEKDDSGNDVDRQVLIPRTVCLFCKCQVHPIEEKPAGN